MYLKTFILLFPCLFVQSIFTGMLTIFAFILSILTKSSAADENPCSVINCLPNRFLARLKLSVLYALKKFPYEEAPLTLKIMFKNVWYPQLRNMRLTDTPINCPPFSNGDATTTSQLFKSVTIFLTADRSLVLSASIVTNTSFFLHFFNTYSIPVLKECKKNDVLVTIEA